MPQPPARDVVVVHSSDLHVDHDYTARLHGGDGTAGLACVLAAANAMAADLVLLAGDTFDHHRVPQALIERAAAHHAARSEDTIMSRRGTIYRRRVGRRRSRPSPMSGSAPCSATPNPLRAAHP